MAWFIVAFLSAFFRGLRDVFNKQSLAHADAYISAWGLRFLTAPFIPLVLVVLLLVQAVTDWFAAASLQFLPATLTAEFWTALVIGGGLNVVGTLLYVKALQHSDLSIVVPLLSFTPAFLLITSPLILQEIPSLLGVVGVLLVTIGAYTLQIDKKNKGDGVLKPVKALLREKGAQYMLVVAVIYSVAGNIDKVGVEASTPVFWAFATHLFIGLGLGVVAWRMHTRDGSLATRSVWQPLALMGGVNAAAITFQMIALTLTLVPYVIAIKRTSMLMAVVFGHYLFGEDHFQERFTGALIMVAGAILLLFA